MEVGAVIRRKMAGAGGGGVWSPSGQGPCRVDHSTPKIGRSLDQGQALGLCVEKVSDEVCGGD